MQTQAGNLAAIEDRESEAAAAAVEHQQTEEGRVSESIQAGKAAVKDARAAVEEQGQALQALILAKVGEFADLSEMDSDDVHQVNADVARAVSEAAFEEQVCRAEGSCVHSTGPRWLDARPSSHGTGIRKCWSAGGVHSPRRRL